MSTPRDPGEEPGQGPGADPPWPERQTDWRHDAPDPPDAFPVPFSIADGLMLAAWSFLVAPLLIYTVLAAVGLDVEPGSAASVVVFLVVEVVVLAGTAAYLVRGEKLTWRLLGPLPPRWRHVLTGVGVGVAGFVVVVTAATVIDQLFGEVQLPEQELLQTSVSGGVPAVLAAVGVVGLAPVIEETIYRGLLFQALRRRLGLWPGLALSSLVFTAVHVELYTSPVGLTAILILGLWLAGAFHRTGTLVVPILGHATFNAINVALAMSDLAG